MADKKQPPEKKKIILPFRIYETIILKIKELNEAYKK